MTAEGSIGQLELLKRHTEARIGTNTSEKRIVGNHGKTRIALPIRPLEPLKRLVLLATPGIYRGNLIRRG